MNFLEKIPVYYCLSISLLIALSAPSTIKLIFIPVVLYLASQSFGKILKNKGFVHFFTDRLFLYYNFIVVTIVVAGGFLSARTLPELATALLFSPIALYFGSKIIPRKKRALDLPVILKPAEAVVQSPTPKKSLRTRGQVKDTPNNPKEEITPIPELKKQDFDHNRRVFIRLIGSAGLSIFIFSLFTKKAQAAFFGSVPGPGTVALKDTSGTQIDPAQNHPTDGYKISEVDDSSPAYYAFIEKGGAWFIMKEDSSGAYRYTKGASSFSTNWTNRASLTYDYFHNTF